MKKEAVKTKVPFARDEIKSHPPPHRNGLGLATAQSQRFKPLVVLQPVFSVTLFVAHRTCSTLPSSYLRCQRAAPSAQNKKSRQKKTARS